MKLVEVMILNFLLLLLFIINLNINLRSQEVTNSIYSFTKSDFLLVFIFMAIFMSLHFTKISRKIEEFILKHYILIFYLFIFFASYSFLFLIFNNDFISIGLSWWITVLCAYFYYFFYDPQSKIYLIINNFLVVIFTLFLTFVVLTVISNFFLYFLFLIVLGIWDIYSVIKSKFMQKIANRYTLKVPVSLIVDYRQRKVAIGNGDLLFFNLFPCIVYFYEKSLVWFVIVYFLQLIGCYVLIKIIIEKIKEPQPFIPYLAFVQSLIFLFITLFNLVK